MKLIQSLTSADGISMILVRSLAMVLILTSMSTVASAQVRSKKPDRGVYQPPRLTTVEVEQAGQSKKTTKNSKSKKNDSVVRQDAKPPRLQQVGHDEDVMLSDPNVELTGSEVVLERPVFHDDPAYLDQGDAWSGETLHDGTCDGCDACVGCDSMGCDSIGSSSGWSNTSLSFSPDRWFGSLELLLMFRSGDGLPALVTTGPEGDADTAGEIGQTGTQVLVGGERVLKDITAGGRLTLGTWLDSSQNRSLVLRGWSATEDSLSFSSNQDQFSVLARPFLNVSDNQAAAQDTQLIAFPDRAFGSVNVEATSNVHGGDISFRQFWYGECGGTIDLLYGYQYMRLSEDLRISSSSTSQDDDFAPVGSVLAISDSFDVENEFHGGQLGFASRYREGCWSFGSLAKMAFGSLQRSSRLSGSTLTSIDGANATDPNGLLIRSTNAGTTTDHTFGWVPELDLSLGWHYFPRYDVTIGYHVIAMTDAIQVSGTMDPNLEVNLADPPTGSQSPAPSFRDDTFYVHGIHFGMRYVY